MLAFNVGVYSQDKLLDNADMLVSVSEGNQISAQPDKGRRVENGLFFTKSVYGNSDARYGTSLRPIEETQKLSRTFELTVDKNGNYFIAAHILPVNNVEKIGKKVNSRSDEIDIVDVSVYVNDKPVGILKQTKLEWELAQLQETKTVSLQAGVNTVRFESDVPYYPMIDAVRITESINDLVVENRAYNDFVEQLKLKSLKSLPAIKESQEEIDAKAREMKNPDVVQLRSAMFPNSYDWQVTPQSFSCPACTYIHMMNVPITYTYYRKLTLSAGSYNFNTAPISGDTYNTVDPVMHLYKINDPHNYSWCNDDDSGYGLQSRISVSNIPAGDYYLVVRAYNSYYASTSLGRQGLVNVYQNGVLLNSNVPVAGYKLDVSSSNSGLLNYFTAYSTGIPIFWLQENGSSAVNWKMKFKGETFFYINPMDYYWFDDARMQLTKNSSVTYSMMIAAEGAMSFYFGNCDAYGSAMSGSNSANFNGSFNNLKNADCIISAPASNNYNCASWAGGRTDLGRYFWASDLPKSDNLSSNWYVPGNYWQSWDNFFGNLPMRSATATTYSRTPNGDAEVSLWTGGHAAVKLDGNLQPHGYDWESKCGGFARMFHPESAFQGSSYGSVLQYYYPVSSASTYSTICFEEELSLGLTVFQDVRLSEDEIKHIEDAHALKNNTYKERYKKLLLDYINKVNSPDYSHISNPEILCNLQEYKELDAYCTKFMDDLYYQIIEDAFSDEALISEIVSSIFFNLTYDTNKMLMEEVKKTWENNCYTSDGAYIAPSPIANRKNYIKKILRNQLYPNNKEKSSDVQELPDNYDVFIVAPNPVNSSSFIKFTLSTDANVIITLTSVQNGSNMVIASGSYKKGFYEIPFNGDKLSKGVYVCTLIVGNTKLSRKILVI